MANRAYLYSRNVYNAAAWRRHSKPYFDSRWNIPLAWFFFYSEANIYLAEISYEDESWKQLKLVAQKDKAIKIFTDRMPLLATILQDKYNPTHVNELLVNVVKWSGEFLLVDPEEVFAGGGYDLEFHIDKFTAIFRELAATTPDHSVLLNNLFFYSGEYFDNEDYQEITVTGTTYW